MRKVCLPIFVFCYLFIASTVLKAQQQQIVPTSPEAASLSKMVNYEVSMNTGIPNIGIPFFEISAGGLTLPIGINYHAGGFKITEAATSVGLGWALTCDLQITRTINGLDDFGFGGYASNIDIKAAYEGSQDIPYRYNMNSSNSYFLAAGEVDGMPDKFNFKLLNKSGSFYIQKSSNGTSYTFVPIPYDNIRIEFTNETFTITDADGTVYRFGAPGSGLGDGTKGKEYSGQMSGGMCVDCKISAWKCMSITNAAGTEQINFSYTNKVVAQHTTFKEQVEWFSNPNPCALGTMPYVKGNSPAITGVTSLQNLLDLYPFHQLSSPKYTEHFAGAKSRFHLPYLNGTTVVDVAMDDIPLNSLYYYTSNVAGLALTGITFRGGSVSFVGADKLTAIRLYDKKNTLVKSVNFFQSYENAREVTDAKLYNGQHFAGTLYLDSLHLVGSGAEPERYSLFYPNKFCFGSHLTGSDAWGYVNKRTMEVRERNNNNNKKVNVPAQTVRYNYVDAISAACMGLNTPADFTFGEDPYAEYPDEELMKKGMLRRIVYPTGGYVDFDFEANRYEVLIGNGQGRGSVLPRIGGGLRVKTISYYDGIALLPVSQKNYRYGELEQGTGLLKHAPEGRFNASFAYKAFSYKQSTYYLKNGNEPYSCYSKSCMMPIVKEDKTTYEPSSSQDMTYSNGAPIYYTKVTEYQRDLGNHMGKTVYKYSDINEYGVGFQESNIISGTNIKLLLPDWGMGVLKSKSAYKFENNSFKLVHRKSYNYRAYSRNERVRVLYSFMRNIYIPIAGSYQGMHADLYNASFSFGLGNVTVTEGDFNADQYGIKIGKLLLDNEKEEIFENQQLTKTVSYSYNHPDYVQPTSITTDNSKGETVTKSYKYPYDFSGQVVYDKMITRNMISPVVEEVLRNNALAKEVSRTKNNYGEFAGGIIVPSSIQQSMNGNPLLTVNTFSKYDNYGNLTEQTGIDGVTKSYLWGYQSMYPVAEIAGMPHSTAISLVNTSILNDPSDDASLRTTLNNLRTSGGAGTLVNTYTYKPLIGVTSITSPEGRAAFYEYDLLGRLKMIKDKDQKIIKQWDYQLAPGFATNALNTYYVNAPEMKTFYQECSAGVFNSYNRILQGGTVFYTNTSYLKYLVEGALDNGEGEMVPIPNSECPSPLQHVRIRMHALFSFQPPPADIEVAFIKDESVVARQRATIDAPEMEKIFYMPVGTYKVTWSPDLKYKSAFLGFAIMATSGGQTTQHFITSGDSFTFQPGVSYFLFSYN